MYPTFIIILIKTCYSILILYFTPIIQTKRIIFLQQTCNNDLPSHRNKYPFNLLTLRNLLNLLNITLINCFKIPYHSLKNNSLQNIVFYSCSNLLGKSYPYPILKILPSFRIFQYLSKYAQLAIIR